MKIYRVVDNGMPLPPVIDLAELGKLFIKMSNKYPKSDFYWVDVDEI